VDQTLERLLVVEGLVVAGVLLVLGAGTWLVVRIGLLPLDRMGHTAGAIAGGDLSHRVDSTDPRTEVGRLGIALNAMLDRLEEAFAERQASEDRLRQFLADASHELRTPLVSIRGYAELFRMGAASSPDDVAKAMRRIEDEATRMGVLVEDLLTLARLDEVAELPHAELDLGELARDAAADARATSPDREVSVQVEPPATVVGEVHQLRQVLANLVRNALVHTPPGTPIEISVAREGDDVRLVVRDHGPGLPTDDPSTLFERFWRAEAGRERGRAGAWPRAGDHRRRGGGPPRPGARRQRGRRRGGLRRPPARRPAAGGAAGTRAGVRAGAAGHDQRPPPAAAPAGAARARGRARAGRRRRSAVGLTAPARDRGLSRLSASSYGPLTVSAEAAAMTTHTLPDSVRHAGRRWRLLPAVTATAAH
jgi:signal transduction histidine kinase